MIKKKITKALKAVAKAPGNLIDHIDKKNQAVKKAKYKKIEAMKAKNRY